jgi:hypothetical protein
MITIDALMHLIRTDGYQNIPDWVLDKRWTGPVPTTEEYNAFCTEQDELDGKNE